MKLISKDNLSLTFQAIKALIERIEAKLLDEHDAIRIAARTGLITPTVDDDGAIYTDENGVIYIL